LWAYAPNSHHAALPVRPQFHELTQYIKQLRDCCELARFLHHYWLNAVRKQFNAPKKCKTEEMSPINKMKALSTLTAAQSPKDHIKNICAKRFTMSPLDKTVLVVEDNDLNRELFHDVPEAHGYNVLQMLA
jgi:hypothetical protein